jgi:hypothetical protein
VSRIYSLVNNSEDLVKVQLGNLIVGIPPKGRLENQDVTNLEEVKKKCAVVEDLSEVGSSSGLQRLDD